MLNAKRLKQIIACAAVFTLLTGSLSACASGSNADSTKTTAQKPAVAAGSTAAAEKEWKLVWSDEFNGANGSPVDSSKWNFDIGNNNGWGNSELEYYTDSIGNCSQKDGNLEIRAMKEKKEGFDYTSARIKTKGLFEVQYGKIEMRAKLPAGQGVWSAFWMLGADIDTNPWPNSGEVDIMENVGKNPGKVLGTIHGPTYYGGRGISGSIETQSNLSNEFHTYTLEWDKDGMKWFVDGKQYHKVPSTGVKNIGGQWVFDNKFFILLNLAIGGNLPGNPDDTSVFPQTYTIDYVRVYQ